LGFLERLEEFSFGTILLSRKKKTAICDQKRLMGGKAGVFPNSISSFFSFLSSKSQGDRDLQGKSLNIKGKYLFHHTEKIEF